MRGKHLLAVFYSRQQLQSSPPHPFFVVHYVGQFFHTHHPIHHITPADRHCLCLLCVLYLVLYLPQSSLHVMRVLVTPILSEANPTMYVAVRLPDITVALAPL